MPVLGQIILLVAIFFHTAGSAKILFIASVPTYSHNVFFRPIWKALADKGHDLTVFTANPMEESYANIKEIDVSFVYKRKAEIAHLTWKSYNWPKILEIFEKMLEDVAVLELNHPEVQNLLRNKTEYFDLVIAEFHIPLMFGFAHRFKCPLIGISSSDMFSEHHALLGNPTHPILFPETYMPFSGDTFLNRVMRFVFRLLRILRNATVKSNTMDILRTYYGPDVPCIEDIMRNINFVFLNTHPLFYYRPLGPKFITIGGGTHIKKPEPLPKELQELMDNSTQGIVYFSLGTNINVQQYPQHLVSTFVEAFSELPYQIIWKFSFNISNLPGNIKILNWVPQQDLLRHKNVKVFITQGGIHSMEEAIYAEVPIIGIPFISDQTKNVFEIKSKGLGVSLDKDSVTKDDVKEAINEVIKNPIYKSKIRKTAQLLKDQPMTGLEKAVWYIEYTIRNKDAQDFFNNPNLNIPWYQYFFLDVIGFLLVLLFAVILLFRILFKILFVVVRQVCLALLKVKRE